MTHRKTKYGRGKSNDECLGEAALKSWNGGIPLRRGGA